MAWQTPLDKSLFSLNNNAPPPQLLNSQQQIQPLPQYQPPQININPLTNPTAKGVYDGIVNQKLLWNSANDEENFYRQMLDSGKYNDAQKQNIQNQIGLLRFQKDESAKAADRLRNTARNLNIDTAGFNADNTLDEALQNKMNYDARAIQGLMNLQSTSQQQENYYNQMLDAGLSPRLARMAANQKLNEFRENNVNQLFNGFQNYGLNDDGSINNFGINLLGKLANEEPQAVALFSSTFATPKESFAEMNTNYRQNLAADNQRQTNLANMQNDWAKFLAAQELAREQSQITAQQNEQKARAAAEKTAYERYLKSPEYLVESTFKIGKMLYGTDEKALEFARAQITKGNNQGIGKDNEQRKIAMNIFNGESLRIRNALKNKDFTGANQMIETVLERLADTSKNYAGYIPLDDHIYMSQALELYKKAANQEITYEQLERAINEMQDIPYIGNVEENLAYLKNNPEILNRMITKELTRRKQKEPKSKPTQTHQYTPDGNYSIPTYNGNWNH